MENANLEYAQAAKLIHEVDKLNEVYINYPEFDDYSVPILRSVKVCESLLITYFRSKGIDVDDSGMIKENNRNCSVLGYITVRKDLFPEECLNYLYIIRNCRNQAAHISLISYDQMVSFKKAFDCFSTWYLLNLKYDDNKDEDSYRLNKLLDDKLSALGISIELTQKEAAMLESITRLVEYSVGYAQLRHQKVKEHSEEYEEEVLSKLSTIMSEIGKHGKKIDDMKSSVDILAEEVRKLSGRIEGYQSLVARQLKLASDNETEKEHIIKSYVDECAARIVDNMKHSYGQREQEIEQNKLIATLGDSAWNKLQESSKSFLISARVMFNSLVNMKNSIDFSGVCLLVTKALEVELSQRFYKGFVAYLKNKYPGRAGLKEWPVGLLGRDGNQLRAEQFSMGNISEILCRWHDPKATEEQKKNNREKLLDYAQEKIFADRSREEIADLLLDYADEIEIIKNNYRNPSAHTGELTVINARDCFDMVLDVEKLLKRMLDSFNREDSNILFNQEV